MKKVIVFSLLIFFGCTNKQKELDCKDQGIKIEYLTDIDKLIRSKYICESSFETFGKSRLDKCKVLFSDKKYKVVYDQYKTRIFIDKKLKLNFAIVCIVPDFKVRESSPNSLYILDEKWMPKYSISKTGEKEYHVYKYEYINGSISLKMAINKESNNINIDKLTYKEIILLVTRIKQKFTYKPVKGGFNDYFYDVPLWTEGYR